MKTVYAPNTNEAYVETLREMAIANPAATFAVGVILLGAVCWYLRDWF